MAARKARKARGEEPGVFLLEQKTAVKRDFSLQLREECFYFPGVCDKIETVFAAGESVAFSAQVC